MPRKFMAIVCEMHAKAKAIWSKAEDRQTKTISHNLWDRSGSMNSRFSFKVQFIISEMHR